MKRCNSCGDNDPTVSWRSDETRLLCAPCWYDAKATPREPIALTATLAERALRFVPSLALARAAQGVVR